MDAYHPGCMVFARSARDCGQSAVCARGFRQWLIVHGAIMKPRARPPFLLLLARCAPAMSVLLRASNREWRGYQMPISPWAAFTGDPLEEKVALLAEMRFADYLWVSFVISEWVIWSFGTGCMGLRWARQLWWKQPCKHTHRFGCTVRWINV